MQEPEQYCCENLYSRDNCWCVRLFGGKYMNDILQKQRRFFASGQTLPVKTRLEYLKKLRQAIIQRQDDICRALQQDLGKSEMEAYMCEVGLALEEISYFLKNLHKLAKDKTVPTSLANFPARSIIRPVPRGNVLIISPWNYPFLLCVEPLVDAVAAGNTAVLKPSAYAAHTSEIVRQIMAAVFPPEYVSVVRGGRAENQALLSRKFDYIFFTGSAAVGKEVLRQAAENLTPVSLELGGKSPCIVDESANIALAARRIVFGKFLNCGQTCVAPDYILCPEHIQKELTEALGSEIRRQFGPDPLHNEAYGRIINEKHFHRLVGLLDKQQVVFGGKSDAGLLKIEPTLLGGVSWQDEVMKEEIFGPVLPIVSYTSLEEELKRLESRPRPLALYIFSSNQKRIKQITHRCRYGGGCINDVIMHLTTPYMPFGGVGESGMGCYHGQFGFDTFSHKKSILERKTWLDLPVRYQPYDRWKKRLLKLFLR